MTKFFTTEISNPQFEADNIRHINIKSPSLHQRADITVFVPPNAPKDLPIVVLLHGVYASHWAWVYNGGVHKTTLRLIQSGDIEPMILAMPSDGLWADGSGYIEHSGKQFEHWIIHDVIDAITNIIDPATDVSPLFIAGLSMGGYGALRLAAKYPQRFRGCAGHSSVTHYQQLLPLMESGTPLPPVAEEEQSVFGFMLRNKDHLPPIRFDCGTDDFLLEANRALHRALLDNQIKHSYEEFPGDHNWDYWSKHIEKSLRFFDQIARGDTS